MTAKQYIEQISRFDLEQMDRTGNYSQEYYDFSDKIDALTDAEKIELRTTLESLKVKTMLRSLYFNYATQKYI